MERIAKMTYALLRQFEVEDRSRAIAAFLLDHPTYSVRKLSREFSISKSQVHRDLHNLRFIDDELYISCMHILNSHVK